MMFLQGNKLLLPNHINQIAFNVPVKKSRIRNIKNNLVFISNHGTKINRSNLKRA